MYSACYNQFVFWNQALIKMKTLSILFAFSIGLAVAHPRKQKIEDDDALAIST